MNVVFDFGGVLFNWAPQDFLTRMLPHRAESPQAARALVDSFFQGYSGDWGAFDRGTIEPEPLAQAIALRTGLGVDETRRVIEGVPSELQPIAGTVALLRRLHERGCALYFLSNMPEPYARHLEASHEFLGLFRRGVFSSRVQLVKPEPAIFAHAARHFEVDPAQTLFIDDHEPNIHAARAAGWRALHFQSPAQCEAALAGHGLL